MDFLFKPEHRIARELFREFAIKEVEPFAQEVDENERFPIETVEKMAKQGFLGISVPEELGGQGGDILTYVLCVEELSRVCATTGVIVSAHTSLAIAPILEHGNKEQIARYIPSLASGKVLGAFGLTEPNAGTDSAAQQTKAVLVGDEYILNGTKIFITNAGYADVYLIMAMTDSSLGNRGISAFIVDANTKGFSIGKKEKKMGIKGSSTCELIFEDCRIPKENLVGKEGGGFKVAMQTLDGGRIGIAAQALGIAQGALDQAVKYVKERKQFGRPISAFQNTQFQIADMATRVEAARGLVYKAAYLKQTKQPYGTAAAMAKLYCSETASYVANHAVQLHGGYGYIREYSVERMVRDAKITEIYEGTSEVQRMVISANLLK